MAILNGNTFSDYRINPLTNVEVPESVTGEIQTVIELSPANVGFYGFELNECPQDNGISSVTRNSDSQVFIRSTSAPSTNEYFIDYINQSPVVIFNATENGEAFTVAYNAIGTPMSVKRTLALAAYNRSIASKMQYLNEKDVIPVAVTYLSDSIKQIRDLTITSSQSIYSNLSNTFGILEIFGNLTVNATYTLTLGRVLLIVHGNIYGSGTIAGTAGAVGGNGTINIYTAGGGSGGGAINIVCFGDIDATINITTGKGGAAGISPTTASDGADAFIDFGGLGGADDGNFGGGGGGIGNGGYYITNATIDGGIGAGGACGNAIVGIGGDKNIWIGSGGDGGDSSAIIAQAGQTGDFNLFSRYTASPCTVNVAAVSGGSAGVENYYDLTLFDDFKQYLQEYFNYYTKGYPRQNKGTNSNGTYNKIETFLTNHGVKSCAYSVAGSVTTVTLPLQYDNATDYIPQITVSALATLTNFNVENITATSFDIRLVSSAGAANIDVYWSTIGNK